MREEKRNNNTVWYRYGEYSFKVNILDSGNAAVWVNFNGFNIAFPIIIRDFLYVVEEFNLDVIVNCDWNEHKGFEVKHEEVDFLIGEILNFCLDNNLDTMDLVEEYSANEWYE